MGKIIAILDENKERRFDFIFKKFNQERGPKLLFTKRDTGVESKSNISEEDTLHLMGWHMPHFTKGTLYLDETVYVDKIIFILRVIKLLDENDVLVYVIFKQLSAEMLELVDEVYKGDITNPNILEILKKSKVKITEMVNSEN